MIKRFPHFYIEKNDNDAIDRPDWMENVTEHINQLSEIEANEIAKYMTLAPIIVAWMGTIKDPMNPNKQIGTTEYSDGVYIWEDIHIHLVKNYRVDPPREFIEHVISFGGNYMHLKNLDVDLIKGQVKRIFINDRNVAVAEDLSIRFKY